MPRIPCRAAGCLLLVLSYLGPPAAAAPEMMRPGEPHRRLDFMIGDWDVASRAHMGDRVHELGHRTSFVWLPGGVWLEERSGEFETPIGKMFGGSRMAWDSHANEYVRYWIDNQSVTVLPTRGTFVDDNTLELRGSFEWVDGTTFHERVVIRNDAGAGFTMTGYMGRDPENLPLNHEAVYRPVAAAAMPDWLREHMEFMTKDGGRWVTDNGAYRSESEPWDAYGLEWKWGIGKQSLVGRLFGLKDGAEQATFWEFRTLWHPGEGRVQVLQFGGHGVVGSGWSESAGEGRSKLVQVFHNPDGSSNTVAHESTDRPDGTHVTASFDVQPDGTWKPRRSYVWKREPARQGP